MVTHLQAQEPQAQVNSTTALLEQGLGGQTIDISSKSAQQVSTKSTVSWADATCRLMHCSSCKQLRSLQAYLQIWPHFYVA